MKHLIFSTLLLCGALWSCDQENFDHTVSTTESFSPNATELSPYKWAVGIDTLPIALDSSWVSSIADEEVQIIGIGHLGPPSAPHLEYLSYAMEFSIPGASDLEPLQPGNYELIKLVQQYHRFNSSSNTWEILIDQEWTEGQIDGIVEISAAAEVYEPIYGVNVWEYTGFATGTLIDDDGTSHELTSAFHRLR